MPPPVHASPARSRFVPALLLAAIAACDCGSGGLAQITCGDGTCSAGEETCGGCPQDCACGPGSRCDTDGKACLRTCGDGVCSPADRENCSSCAGDCACGLAYFCDDGACSPTCGDGTCEPARGETCTTCGADCGCSGTATCVEGACRSLCGDGTCEAARGEGCASCAADCACDASSAICLNDKCLLTCGNGSCDAAFDEDCAKCPADCGCTDGKSCQPSTGACVAACDATTDCRLALVHATDLLASAGTGTIAGAAVAVDGAGGVVVGYARSDDFAIAKLSGSAFTQLTPAATNGYVWGERALALTEPGRITAVYDKTTGGSHVMATRSTNAGASWTAPAQLDVATHSDNGAEVALAWDGATLHAVYTAFAAGCTQSSCYEVFYSASTDRGATWGAPVRITRDSAQDDHAAVAVDGNLVVVGSATHDGAILVARSTDHGRTFSAPQKVNDGTFEATAYAPNFVAVRGQRVHVVWSDDRDDSEGDIFMDTSLDGGATWGVDKPVHGRSTRWDQSPGVRIAPDGRAWVLWQHHNGSDHDLFAAATTDGECFCKAVRFTRASASDQANPDFTLDAAGRIHAGWREETSGGFEIRYNAATPE